MKPGELLAICRELKGLTLREVEVGTGISNAFLSQVETGKSKLGLENAVKLCDFYGISLERLAKTVRENFSKEAKYD